MTSLRFTLNGREIDASGADPNQTLLLFLRERGYTGTKEGCSEGECGACAVLLVLPAPEGGARYVPVNSCLFLLASAAGREIITVEGVAREGALHPVQEAMVRLGGSQCGYCTPGFVVSLFAEYYRPGREEGGFDVESIAGNLCRCTGYRPIRDAGRGLPTSISGDDPHAARLREPAPPERPFSYERGSRRYLRPTSLTEATRLLRDHPELTVVSGGTDVVVELNQRLRRLEGILSLEAVEELRVFHEDEDALSIGAALPLSEIEENLDGTLPILGELLPLFSSRLVRNRATLGGNLATASPIGDSPPVLLALDAEVIVASAAGERVIPIDELFTGYRTTSLEADELIVRVRIPKPFPTIGRFYKVSKRAHDDISTVAAGFSLRIEGGLVRHARLAYGGVAATPARAREAEAALEGRPFSEASVAEAKARLGEAFTPLSDQRGSARYRRAMVTSLLDKLLAETEALA